MNKKLLLMEIKYKELGEIISCTVLQLFITRMGSIFKANVKMEWKFRVWFVSKMELNMLVALGRTYLMEWVFYGIQRIEWLNAIGI